MLYTSLHVPAGAQPFPRSVLQSASIAHYLHAFGTHDGDDAQVATTTEGRWLGAAWCRRMSATDPGYGFVDEATPELGMAVISAARGRGIGSALLADLLERHPTMSLSVDDDNVGARRLYERHGFVTVNTDANSTTMVRRLR